MLVEFTQKAGDDLVSEFSAGVNAEAYQQMSSTRYSHPLSEQMRILPPFSREYRQTAMQLYSDLRGNVGHSYNPALDEVSGIPEHVEDAHKNASPWNFKDPALISEFLFSWGQIFRHLNVKSGQSVLEYGPGSGQTLLMLARAGVDCYGVDIDLASLHLLKQQADSLGVRVTTEQGQFGDGFENQKFDRVLFFEAFHHAFDFENLLLRLHDRLNPGGRIVFCGEPIISGSDSAIPYPWGPRLDALSVFCTRARGWMELGFQHDTFVELLWRCGWRVKLYPFDGCGRANVYVAESIWSGVGICEDIELGSLVSGWQPSEGAHRWTSGESKIFMPVAASRSTSVRLVVSNFLGTKKHIRVSCGSAVSQVQLGVGEKDKTIVVDKCDGPVLTIQCNTDLPPNDPRPLGIAVHQMDVAAG